jgi:peptide/nickel transport system permease protein
MLASGMGRFVIHRFVWAIFLFFVVTLITYVLFYRVPSDPVFLAGGTGAAATPELVAHTRHLLHLDLPLYQQYWLFVWNMMRHGSLGYSFRNRQPVRWIIGQDAPVTASLVLGGVVFWLAVSVPLGILSALRPRSPFDRMTMIFVLIGVSVPAFLVGLVLLYVFGFKLGWTPIAGYCNFIPTSQVGICSGPVQWAYHLLLPWTTFTLLFVALYTRMIRAGVLETLREDYVRTALAKGASGRAVLFRHVLRNSMLQVVTMLGMDVGLALGNAVFTEYTFDLHGLGTELLGAVLSRDLTTVVGIVVCAAVLVIVFNFIVDVAYAYLDPRIRLTA